MVNTAPFLLPNAVTFIPCATMHISEQQRSLDLPQWICGYAAQFQNMQFSVKSCLQDLWTRLSIFKCLGSDRHYLRSRVLRSQSKLAPIKTSDNALPVWKAIINNVFSYFLSSREMHDKNKKQTWKIAGVGAMPNKHLNKICISKIKAVYRRVDVKCSMTNHQGQL